MIVGCILPFVGMLVMSLLPNTPEYKWTKWGMFLMTVVFNLPIFLGWSLSKSPSLADSLPTQFQLLVPSNVAGKTKNTVISSMTLIAYCVGNMGGVQVFKTKDAPRYVSGTVSCSICFILEAIVILLWRLWYMWENRRRDRLVAESSLTKEEQAQRGQELGERDVTDLQNPYFRYSM